MNEDYKICPYCNNAVDKKDKQCPYCLESLSRRSSSNAQINNNTTNSEYVNRDSGIKDNSEWTNFEMPPLFQKFLDLQKEARLWKDDQITAKEAKKIALIFILIFLWVPLLIVIIASIFWD